MLRMVLYPGCCRIKVKRTTNTILFALAVRARVTLCLVWQPFAFAARNYLRKLLVGKEVTFRVNHQAQSGREYGTLELNQENVAYMLVREGWANVREVRASDAENVDVEALYSYKAEAEAAKRGIWQENESVSTNFDVFCDGATQGAMHNWTRWN